MKKSLQKIYWLSILATLLMTFIAVTMMVKLKIDDTREDLRNTLYVASAWTLDSEADLQSLADDIASISAPMRVTFLMDNGLVLADSHEDARRMVNHLNRPEIAEALTGGLGESLRLSVTEAVFMYYEARLVADHLILRLSYPIDEITHLVVLYAVGIVVLFGLLYRMQKHAFERFAREMHRQMDAVRVLMEGDSEETPKVFPELQPAMNSIAYHVRRLKSDLQEVKRTLNVRSDFVANASHELRSPLTSIMGFAEMLDEGFAETREEQQLCVRTIRSECRRMLDVIEDILLLSRSEEQSAPAARAVDVTAVAGEIIQSLSPRAAGRGIALTLDGCMEITAIEKDIWEILYNLIDNAIRYGRENGRVKVVLEADRIVVEDDGIGIPAAHLPHIFEKFYRVDEARDARGAGGGSGLGLSIVRSLAERNGAGITVTSELGKGSCFTVTFTHNVP